MIDNSKARPPVREPPREASARQRWQPRFGLGTMMLVMLVCGVMSSAGYYLVRGNMTRRGEEGAGDNRLQLVFILITLASPLLVAAAISLVLQLTRFISRRRPSPKPPRPPE